MACPVMYAFDKKGHCIPVRCGQWSCPECAKRLARRWASIAGYGVQTKGQGKAYFWTLTMGRKIKTPKYAYLKLPHMWDSLRKSMQRIYPEWCYLAFVEGQPKRGNMPHFHIITLQPSPMPRLKDYVTRFGFGFQATEDVIKSRKAYSYVAKYATKQNKDTPKGFRRVRVSRNWPKRLKREKGDSLIVKSKKESLTDYFSRVSRVTGVTIDKIMTSYYSELMKKHGET